MPRKTGFNKLLDSNTTLLSRAPLLGLLKLDTDSGSTEVAVNRVVAERLVADLIEFLEAGEGGGN